MYKTRWVGSMILLVQVVGRIGRAVLYIFLLAGFRWVHIRFLRHLALRVHHWALQMPPRILDHGRAAVRARIEWRLLRMRSLLEPAAAPEPTASSSSPSPSTAPASPASPPVVRVPIPSAAERPLVAAVHHQVCRLQCEFAVCIMPIKGGGSNWPIGIGVGILAVASYFARAVRPFILECELFYPLSYWNNTNDCLSSVM